jgi:hypothetical protein
VTEQHTATVLETAKHVPESAENRTKVGAQKAAWEWTEARALAAQLVAGGQLTLPDIAARAGVSARQLFNWRRRPEFKARVREHLDLFVKELRKESLARWWERLG